jgi:chaperone modulatory protein CbpM
MMITMAEALQKLHDMPDRMTLEGYIAHSWVRPVKRDKQWYFEEIDIARIKLVHNLRQDMMVSEEDMDVVLHLLDQLYGLREQMRRLEYAIKRQPRDIQAGLYALVKEMDDEYIGAGL